MGPTFANFITFSPFVMNVLVKKEFRKRCWVKKVWCVWQVPNLRSFVINLLVEHPATLICYCGENCGEFLLGTIFEYVKRVGIVAREGHQSKYTLPDHRVRIEVRAAITNQRPFSSS